MGIFNDNSQNDHYGHIKVAERGPTGPAGKDGTGFELTDKGNYDIDGKRLTDVSQPVAGTDAATKAYVDEKTGRHTGNLYHLRNSFEFYDSSGTKLALSTDNITGLLSDYKHGYYKVSKDSDESTYSKVSIEIKNNLPNSTYSALFYLYGYNNNNIMTGDDLDPILFGARGINYHVLWYTDDDDSLQTKNHTKGLIWFTADGDGSIEIELRFFDKPITHFVVLSRCVEGKVNLGFSIDIFNVAHNSSGTFYFEEINMNNREIKNLGGPTDDGDAANKKYVDTANSKQDIAIADKANKSYADGEKAKVNIDTTPLLPRNGSRSMFGDLDMDGNHILSVENLADYEIHAPLDYDYRVKDLKSVVNKEYLNENFLKKVDKDGREYYDLKQIVIKNSAAHDDGSYDNDTLVSKAFIDAEISKLPKPDTDVLKLDGSKCKNFYKLLITAKAKLPNMSKKLISDLDISNSLEEIYSLPRTVASETYIWSFQYRVLNYILYTNAKLFKIGLSLNDKCTFCDSSKEELYHLFFECSHAQIFWKTFSSWWFELVKENIAMTLKDIILGLLKRTDIINYLIILGKLCIWECRKAGIFSGILVFFLKK